MKKSLIVTALIAASALSVSFSCHAFGLGGIGSMMGGGSKSGGTDLSAIQDQSIKDYVGASTLLISANKKMGDALGLKDQMAGLDETASSLKDGTSQDSIKKSEEAISNSTKAISDAISKHPTLSAASKAMFGSGLVDMVKGTIGFSTVAKEISAANSAISSASLMELPKLGGLVSLSKNVPGDVKNYSSALSTALQFAKDNHIPEPKNAADAVAAMGAM